MSTKDLGITGKKADDLSEWYTQIVTKAQLADYSSAKGFMVLMPYGFSIWESIKEHFDRKIKEIGHRNAYFPLLIPERLLKREAEHFEGFTPEVFWVTHSGNNELSERLAIRPTSETIINESYSKWVKSWRDLPVLINVWNSVLRAEITSTKPFIRTTEFLWQEGHTVHGTEEEAEKEVMTILEIYRRLVEDQGSSLHHDSRSYDAGWEGDPDGNQPPLGTELFQALRDQIPGQGRERTLRLDHLLGNQLATDRSHDHGPWRRQRTSPPPSRSADTGRFRPDTLQRIRQGTHPTDSSSYRRESREALRPNLH